MLERPPLMIFRPRGWMQGVNLGYYGEHEARARCTRPSGRGARPATSFRYDLLSCQVLRALGFQDAGDSQVPLPDLRTLLAEGRWGGWRPARSRGFRRGPSGHGASTRERPFGAADRCLHGALPESRAATVCVQLPPTR